MYGSLGESTIPKYMNSLCQCWSVYGSLGESACCKGMPNEVLGSLGVSTVVQVSIWAVCQCRAVYRQSRSVYRSLQEVYSSLRKSIVSLWPSLAVYGSLVQPTFL